MSRYLVREETFGFTVFDKLTLSHEFLRAKDFQLTSFGGDYEYWQSDLEGLPTGLLCAPIRIYFEITRSCNLRCSHCFNSSGKRMMNEMSTTAMLKVLDGLRGDNVLDIRFSGGELTVRKDWAAVLRKSVELGFATSCNTNGVYRSEEIIDELCDINLNQVTLSLDGANKVHDQIRGDGTFEKTVSAIKKLHFGGASLRVNVVINRRNASDVPAILEIVAPFISEINFFHMRIVGRARELASEALSYRELHEFQEVMLRVKEDYPNVRILHNQMVTNENSISSNLHEEFGLRIGGPDGFTRLNIIPDGTIWPGGYVPHIDPRYCVGNVLHDGFSVHSAWRTSQVMDRWRSLSKAYRARCEGCSEYQNRCAGFNMEMELNRRFDSEHRNPYCIYGPLVSV